MAEDRPSFFCTVAYIKCHDSKSILKIDFQINIKFVLRNTILNDKKCNKIKTIIIFKEIKVSTQNYTLRHLNPRVLFLSNICTY